MKAQFQIPFMKWRLIGFVVSAIIVSSSLFIWFTSGNEKYGLDFMGGSEVVVRFSEPVSISDIRASLAEGGIKDSIVQTFGDEANDFSIRIKSNKDTKASKKIRDTLSAKFGMDKIDIQKEDFVGPVIGEQIRNDGITALLTALFIILIYISFRFELRFALGAIAALVHDIIITSGVFIFSGREISAAVLAGLLTIIGYSLNDTIIVYDRIRENIEKDIKKYGMKKGAGTSLVELINTSINQTLSRTLLTSLTTFFVVFVLWLFGGGAVSDLAFTLVIGVVVGTYSSIFIASPILLYFAAKAEE